MQKKVFLSNSQMQHPACSYPRLERKTYETSLRRIAEYLNSGKIAALPFYERQLTEMMLIFNAKKHRLLLAVCDYHNACSPEEKADAETRHRAANQALYGVPDRLEFEAIVYSLLERIKERPRTAEEDNAFAELLDLLPFQVSDKASVYRPKPEMLQQFSQMVRRFYAPILSHIPAGKETFSIQDAVDTANEILQTELDEFGEIWHAVAEAGRTSCAVNQEKRTILFPAARIPNRYSRQELEMILVHEIGVHVMRAMPYQNMPVWAFSRGLPGYETAEEGIAKLMEQGVSGIYQESGIVHYVSAGLAHFYRLNFREIFEIQKRLQGLSRDVTENACYLSVQRTFRGTDTLPIYKDMVYYSGTMRLWHYVTAHIDDPMLFDTLILSAKTDIFHPMQQALVYEAKCGRFDAAVFELP